MGEKGRKEFHILPQGIVLLPGKPEKIQANVRQRDPGASPLLGPVRGRSAPPGRWGPGTLQPPLAHPESAAERRGCGAAVRLPGRAVAPECGAGGGGGPRTAVVSEELLTAPGPAAESQDPQTRTRSVGSSACPESGRNARTERGGGGEARVGRLRSTAGNHLGGRPLQPAPGPPAGRCPPREGPAEQPRPLFLRSLGRVLLLLFPLRLLLSSGSSVQKLIGLCTF